MNLALRFALGLANVPEADANALDAALPALGRLSADVTELDPIPRRIFPDAQKALGIVLNAWAQLDPLFEKNIGDLEKMFPIILRAYPDFVSVMPVLEKLLKLAEGPKT